MSRYWFGLLMPGCGRQSRDVGRHGKIESNAAVGQLRPQLERGRRGRAPLDPEVPDVEGVERRTVGAAVVLGAHDRDRRVGRRLLLAVDVGGEQAVADEGQHPRRVAVEVEGHGTRRLAAEHPVLLEPVDADAVLAGRAELAGRDDVGVGPHAVLRVVREVQAGGEGVAVVRPCRVARRGDGDAVVEGQGRVVETSRRELAEDPPVGKLVVDHDGVAGRVGAVGHGEALPQGARVDRTEQPRAGLRIDREDEVDHLDVVVRADVSHRVGRVDPPAEDGEIVLVGQALEVGEGRAHCRCGDLGRLGDGVRAGALGGRGCPGCAAFLGEVRRARVERPGCARKDGQRSGDVMGDVVGEDGASLIGGSRGCRGDGRSREGGCDQGGTGESRDRGGQLPGPVW